MGGQSFDASDNGGFTDYTMEKVCVNGASAEDCDHWFHLGQRLGLTDFNPTTVNWNKPVEWAGSNCSMSDSSGCLISLGLGFAIVLGFGVFFSIFTSMLVWMEKKFGGVKMTSEHFNTGGRDVKTGLTASVIVSQWTWAATLLQSSNVAWTFGISGPFWYAAGASIQVRTLACPRVLRPTSGTGSHVEVCARLWECHGTAPCFRASRCYSSASWRSR